MRHEHKTAIAGKISSCPLDSVITRAKGAWFVDRLMYRAYKGALFQLKRVSDSATLDIYPLPNGRANLAAAKNFCDAGSSNGTVVKWYDQSGNGKDLTPQQATGPIIYTFGSGFSTSNGRVAVALRLSPSALTMGRADSLGITGDVAVTLAWCGTWSGATGAGAPISIGTAASLTDFVAVGVSDSSKLKMSYFGATRTFNLNRVGTTQGYYVASRAASALNTAITLRQNGAACTQSATNGSSTCTLGSGGFALGNDITQGEQTDFNMPGACAFNAVISGADLTALEAALAQNMA